MKPYDQRHHHCPTLRFGRVMQDMDGWIMGFIYGGIILILRMRLLKRLCRVLWCIETSEELPWM